MRNNVGHYYFKKIMLGGLRMSLEHIKLFYEKMEQDERLKENISRFILEEQDNFSDKIANLGEISGYHFTKEEFRQVINEVFQAIQISDGLDDSVLEEVTGGSVVGTVVFLTGVTTLTLVIGTGVSALLIGQHID